MAKVSRAKADRKSTRLNSSHTKIYTLSLHDALPILVGSRTRVKIVKNKTAAPFREAEFDMMYGEGISREGDLLDLAVNGNLVEKSGSWFSYKGERIGQGRENAKQFLKENKDIAAKIEADVRKSLGLISVEDKAQAAAANAEAAPHATPKPPAGRK